jgi:hypothetical protein
MSLALSKSTKSNSTTFFLKPDPNLIDFRFRLMNSLVTFKPDDRRVQDVLELDK